MILFNYFSKFNILYNLEITCFNRGDLMYLKGDFHIHTTASDGHLTSEKVVSLSKENGLDIIAITDHDTTAGVEKAISCGNALNLKVIPGIELSVLHKEESVHILGYFKDDSYKNNKLQNFLKDMHDYRIYRAKKIVENLETFFNIKIDYDKIYKSAKGVIARPHIASAILEAGYPYSWNYIFDNIINKESPAYVSNKKITISQGIALLKSFNAVVVLAHPILIKNSTVDELMEYDFDGIEALYYLNSAAQTEELKEKALKYNKLISAGSDFHGIPSGDTKHGTIGEVSLEGLELEKFITAIFKYYAKIKNP